MMWSSLKKLAALPPDTKLYCGHEYTNNNCRFALTVEPENEALRARAAEAAALAEEGEPALPTTIAQELATNPFLRPSSPAIQKRLGMEGRELAEIFGEIRRRKDRF
jgi:hydroxyacylglutathione hydrolase